MRSIWQRSRMIAIAVVIVLGAGAIALARPHPISEPVLGTGGNAAALRSSSPAITAETEPLIPMRGVNQPTPPSMTKGCCLCVPKNQTRA